MNNCTPTAVDPQAPTANGGYKRAELASLGQLAALGAKITTLEDALEDAADQIVTQIRRENDVWCHCQVAREILDAQMSERSEKAIALALGLDRIEDVWLNASSCACSDVWLSGALPVDEILPKRPGVYICFDEQDRPAYIGMSKDNVRGRLRIHYRDPEKPRLARWAAFFPGSRGESAAVWEVRLIEQHKPYLNRQHVDDGAPEVSWKPQGERPKAPPWYERDEAFQWFRSGPGAGLDWGDSAPWQVAKTLRNLISDGATRAIIEEAVDITIEAEPAYSQIAYMAGVVRTILEESHE